MTSATGAAINDRAVSSRTRCRARAMARFDGHRARNHTYGSWMNLVERWFSALTTKKLQRSAHRSINELAADIQAWAATWNENPTPFIWHKTADQILERLAGYCAALNQNATA